MAFTTVTLTRTYTDEDGSPSTGTVTLQLSSTLVNNDDSVDNDAISLTLDDTGSISQDMTASDDADTVPQNSVVCVTEVIDGAMANQYSVYVLAAMLPAVDLSTLVEQPYETPLNATSYYDPD